MTAFWNTSLFIDLSPANYDYPRNLEKPWANNFNNNKIQVGKGISILTRKVWQARPILLYLTIQGQCESTIYHDASRWNMIAPAGKWTVVLSRNVVESNWLFDNLCGSHFHSQSLPKYIFLSHHIQLFNCATLHYLKTRVNVKVIWNDDIANIRINSSYLVIQKRCLRSFQLNPFPLFIILTEPLRLMQTCLGKILLIFWSTNVLYVIHVFSLKVRCCPA